MQRSARGSQERPAVPRDNVVRVAITRGEVLSQHSDVTVDRGRVNALGNWHCGRRRVWQSEFVYVSLKLVANLGHRGAAFVTAVASKVFRRRPDAAKTGQIN